MEAWTACNHGNVNCMVTMETWIVTLVFCNTIYKKKIQGHIFHQIANICITIVIILITVSQNHLWFCAIFLRNNTERKLFSLNLCYFHLSIKIGVFYFYGLFCSAFGFNSCQIVHIVAIDYCMISIVATVCCMISIVAIYCCMISIFGLDICMISIVAMDCCIDCYMFPIVGS